MMKIISKIFIINFIFLTFLSATPSWYCTIPNEKLSTYIGYGSGKSEQEAKQNALNDISNQIYTKIDFETTQHKTIKDGNYQKDIDTKSTQVSNATLYDYKLLKMIFEDGMFYVAIEYENIPSLDKFVKKIADKTITKQTIIDAIKEDFGAKLGVELFRKDKLWYIKYKTITQLLDKKDFARFFISKSNPNISIHTNKKNDILYENDEFYFKVKTDDNGYVSIFTVYEDGTVSVLLKNIAIEKNSLQNLPDKDFEAIPQAGLLYKNQETYDMYVTILSKKRISFDSFAFADEETISDEKYKNFDELLRFLKDKNYTTLKVVTKPR